MKRIYIKCKRVKIEKKIYGEEEIQRVTGEETKRKKGRKGRRIKEDEKGSGGLEIYKQEERKKWNENNIREEWRNYFRNLLEGVEGEEVIEEKEKRGEEQEAEEIEEAVVRGGKKNEKEKDSWSGRDTDGGLEVCRRKVMEKGSANEENMKRRYDSTRLKEWDNCAFTQEGI